jgi:hypothetical protein
MEIELISRETIKPSLQTPSHLRIYPLSFIDNIMFRTYVPPIFFYKPNNGIDQNTIIYITTPKILISSSIKILSLWWKIRTTDLILIIR